MKEIKSNPAPVVTVEEFARENRLSRGAAYAGVRSGEIPSIKIGRRILIPRAAWERRLTGEAK